MGTCRSLGAGRNSGGVDRTERHTAVAVLALFAAFCLVIAVIGATGNSIAATAGGGGSPIPSDTGSTVAAGAGSTVPSGESTSQVSVTLKEYVVNPTVIQVKAGDVAFTVPNVGKIEHEMLVLKTDTPFDQLPIVAAGDPPAVVTIGANKVDEASKVAETGDPNVQPGETRTFTADELKPGQYLLICNIGGHYGLGMRVAFTVAA